MKFLPSSAHSLSLFALGFVAWQSDAGAQTVINGNFNANGPGVGENLITPLNWVYPRGLGFLGDINNASGTVHTEAILGAPFEWSDPVVSSPDGGNWANLRAINLGMPSGGSVGESIAQGVREWTVTPGLAYAFSFERAYQPFNSIAFPGAPATREGGLRLTFHGDANGDTIPDTLLDSIDFGPIGTPQSWRTERGILTIPNAPLLQSRTITVTFAALSPAGSTGLTSYVGIDNLQISPIPEPTTPLLLGLTGLCAVFRRSR